MDEKEFKGLLGESLTEMLLQRNLGVYKQIIHDVVIPTKEDKTTQIDNILITAKGIFVIENKNWNGIIKRKQNGDWYIILNKEKYHIEFDPIKQNEYHIKYLKKLLGKEDDLFYSLIVLGYNAKNQLSIQDLKNTKVIKIDELIETITTIFLNTNDNKLSHEEIDDIYLKLKYNYGNK